MQIDWAHFGHLQIGCAERQLMSFVAVLSCSRRVFLRFCLNAQMDSFLRGCGCPDSADTFSTEKQSDMPTPKSPWSAAIRQQMVKLVRAGRGPTELARDFGSNTSSIHAWVKAERASGGAATGVTQDNAVGRRAPGLQERRRKFKHVQWSGRGGTGSAHRRHARPRRPGVHF